MGLMTEVTLTSEVNSLSSSPSCQSPDDQSQQEVPERAPAVVSSKVLFDMSYRFFFSFMIVMEQSLPRRHSCGPDLLRSSHSHQTQHPKPEPF